MASTIRVTTTILHQKADQLKELNTKFKAEVTNIRESEQRLAGMWEGEAQKAFHNQFQTDCGKFDTFYNGIEQYVQRLMETAQAYDKAEQQNLATAQTRKS